MRHGRAICSLLCLIASALASPPVLLGYQDSLGQYSFGYSAPGSARSEVRTSNGATRGSYSYVDGAGNIQIAQYEADDINGFRIVATNLPQAPLPVQDTPEVTAARVAHLQALEAAQRAEENSENRVESRSKASSDESMENANSTEKDLKQELQQTATNSESQLTQMDQSGNPNSDVQARSGVKSEKSESVENQEKQEKANSTNIAKSANESEENGEKSSEVSSGRAEETINLLNTVPILLPQPSSHLLISPAIHNPPIFRIAHGNQEIAPVPIPQTKDQGSSNTPAGTSLKSEGSNSQGTSSNQEERKEEKASKDSVVKTIIAPSIVPLGYSQSSFIAHNPPIPVSYLITHNII